MSISICGTFCQLDANLTHTYYYLSLVSLEKKWLYHPLVLLGIVVIFFVQQVVMTIESSKRTIGPYSTTMSTITDPSYYNTKLAKVIQQINHKNNNPLHRIDYMSFYALNSPFIYHYNGISLYSSIFDGSILNYYDHLMQINMPVDKNSTYRYLSNRANLEALWNVQDRFRHPNDLNIPYGFKR